MELARGEHQVLPKCGTTLPGDIIEVQILFRNILKESETLQVILLYAQV